MKKLIFGMAAASLCALAPLPIFSQSAFAGALEDGMSAYEAGNNAKAVSLFKKAAGEGDTRAYLNLGIFYESSIGVPQSDAMAFYWTRKAAQAGDMNGQFNVANMYARGYGTAKSDVDALSWYRTAAYQGHMDAQFNMGVRYYEGRGVPQSDKEAEFWFEKAAAQGDEQAADALKIIRRKQAKEFNKQLRNGQ